MKWFNHPAVLWGLTFVVLAAAQLTVQSQEQSSNPDIEFVKEAASGGMLEVALGALAKERGQNESVRDFGEHMINDHGKANMELLAIAERKQIKVAEDLMPKHQQCLDKLKAVAPDAFDREYMTSMLKDHKEDIEKFAKESEQGSDADIRAFAKEKLPTLRHHLEMAKKASAKIEGSGGR